MYVQSKCLAWVSSNAGIVGVSSGGESGDEIVDKLSELPALSLCRAVRTFQRLIGIRYLRDKTLGPR